MSWRVIKRGLFVTIEGLRRAGGSEKCTYSLFNQCRKFDTSECDRYWITCWERFRVKEFNKVTYEGERYYEAEYVYDVSEMKYLLIISGVLWSLLIIVVINLVLNP